MSLRTNNDGVLGNKNLESKMKQGACLVTCHVLQVYCTTASLYCTVVVVPGRQQGLPMQDQVRPNQAPGRALPASHRSAGRSRMASASFRLSRLFSSRRNGARLPTRPKSTTIGRPRKKDSGPAGACIAVKKPRRGERVVKKARKDRRQPRATTKRTGVEG